MKTLIPSCSNDNLLLLKSKKGSFSLKVKSEDGSLKTIHSLYDPEEEARTAVNDFHFDADGILVILGLGLGYHLVELTKKFPQAVFLVVEAVPAIYEMAQKYGKIAQLQGKIKFLVGMPGDEIIKNISRHQIKKGMAPISVFSLPSALSCFSQYYQPLIASIKNITSVRLWEKLKYSKFKEATKRIILIDFDYFLIREVENAIARLGHKILKVPIRKGDDSNDIVPSLIDKIITFKPDFFLTINHWGFDEEGVLTDFFRAIEMPVASWYVDSPNLIIKAFNKNTSPFSTIFLWDKGYIKDMKSMGFEAVCYLPLATDETIFKPVQAENQNEKIRSCNVGFVGNSMAGPAQESKAKVSPELHNLIEKLAKEVLKTRLPFDEHLKRLDAADSILISKLDRAERINAEAAVLWKTTLLYRLNCIKKLIDFNAHIHGDNGWKELLGQTGDIFPPLSYYRELPFFFNVCKINFNATSLQMNKAVNQRVFDVPACGAFLITDHQESLGELFDIGKEVIVFDCPEDIPDLLRYYLKNPEKRGKIALQGRERVLKEHTYQHRLKSIIHNMQVRYG